MASEQALSTQGICLAARYFAEALETHRRMIDLLNVYPVPDGDTGTNMTLTLRSVCEALDELSEAQRNDRLVVCEAIAKSALMGARGNSGVIISQFLRAMVHVLAQTPAGAGVSAEPVSTEPVGGEPVSAEPVGGEPVSAEQLAEALMAGSVAADASVMKPVEGTILSVARAAAKAAQAACRPAGTSPADTEPAGTEPVSGEPAGTSPADPPPALVSLTQVLEAASTAGQTALEHTPQQLPVLAEAGVVDAGAVGFLLWLAALAKVVSNRPLPAELDLPSDVLDNLYQPAQAQSAQDQPAASPAAVDPAAASPGLGPRYEVMYLLDSQDEQVNAMRQTWSQLGDSIVVAGGDGLWNCHIHTDHIGATIEAGIAAGRPHRIAITDLHEQVDQRERSHDHDHAHDHAHDHDAAAAHPTEPAAALPTAPATCAVVATSPATGIDEIFTQLGVSALVTGGQTMNPSTAELLAAIDATSCNEVVLLPNNANIIAAAEQAAEHSTKQVRVVPTRSIVHGVVSMLGFDPNGTADTNAEQMADMTNSVIAGEVTQAVRSTAAQSSQAQSSQTQVNVGDWIGLCDQVEGHIVSVADNLSQAAIELLSQLIQPEHDALTVITGEGATAAATAAIKSWLTQTHALVKPDFLVGGQAHYPYLFGLE